MLRYFHWLNTIQIKNSEAQTLILGFYQLRCSDSSSIASVFFCNLFLHKNSGGRFVGAAVEKLKETIAKYQQSVFKWLCLVIST